MLRPSIQLKLKGAVGEGEQGRVFEALRIDRRTNLRQTVAVKILHSETEVELWRQEFTSLSAVRSPYCVRVLSFERVRGRPALVLEFVRGVTLAQWRTAGLGTTGDAREILAQIRAGLEDLRAQASVHGDLSPANVMIDDRGVIRLLDFGLANGSGTRTRCTPEFAAPERLRGDPPTYGSDLYSLGCLGAYLSDDFNPGSLLDVDPGRRRPATDQPDPRRSKRLARLVNAHLARKSNGSARTRGLPGRRRGFAWRALAAGVLCAVLNAPATPPPTPPKFGTLVIASTRWRRFTLDGAALGFAPLSTVVTSGDAHVLEWAGSRGDAGVLRVRVKPAERRRLGDRDFSH